MVPRRVCHWLVVVLLACCEWDGVHATASAPQPIVFGQLAPLEGAWSQVAEDVRRGFQAAFAQVGLDARVITYDSANGTESTQQNALRLIHEDKAVALLGVVGSDAASSVLDISAAEGVPCVAPVSGHQSLRHPFKRDALNFRASILDEVAAALDYLLELKAARISVVYPMELEAVYEDVVKILGDHQMTALSHHSFQGRGNNTELLQAALKSVERLEVLGVAPEAVLVFGESAPVVELVRRVSELATRRGFQLHIVAAGVLGVDSIAHELRSFDVHEMVTFTVPVASTPLPSEHGEINATRTLLTAEYMEALRQFAPGANRTLALYEGFLTGRLMAEVLQLQGEGQSIPDVVYDQAILRLLDFRIGPFGADCEQLAAGCSCNQGARSVAHAGIRDDGKLYTLHRRFDFYSCGYVVPEASAIRLGHIAPLSGPKSQIGVAIHRGILAAILEARNSGELGTTTLELLAHDDEGNASLAKELTRQSIVDQNALVVLAPVGHEASMAVAQEALQHRTPVVAPLSGTRLLRTPFRRDIIHLYPSTVQQADVLVRLLDEETRDECTLPLPVCGPRAFFMIALNSTFGLEAHDGVLNSLHKRGLVINSLSWIHDPSVEFWSNCQLVLADLRSTSLRPSAVIMAGPLHLVNILTSCVSAEYSTSLLGAMLEAGTEQTENMLREWPQDGVHIAHVTPALTWQPRSLLALRYIEAMNVSGFQQGVANGLDQVAFEGYVIGRMVLEVLRGLWPITRQGFIDSFYSLGTFQLAADYTVGPFIDQGANESSSGCSIAREELFVSRVARNGSFLPFPNETRTWPASETCGSVSQRCRKGLYRQSPDEVCILCELGNDIISYTDHVSCEPCGPGTTGKLYGKCDACAVGTYNDDVGITGECPECSPGHFANLPGMTACISCPVGEVQPQSGRSHCIPCSPGEYSDEESGSHCMSCPRGSKAEQMGTSTCTLCSPGHFSEESGQSLCRPCSAGQFQDDSGRSKCKQCGLGKYADERGLTRCKGCPGAYNTSERGASSLVECMCPEGTYEPDGEYETPVCTPCPVAMKCEWGSQEANLYNGSAARDELRIPEATLGYMTLTERPLQPYRCRDKEVCPGGWPGSCNHGFDSSAVACGECRNGHYKSTGAACHDCGSWDWAPALGAVASISAIVIVTTHFVNRSHVLRSHSSMSALVVLGMVMRSYQLLSIYQVLELEWYEPVATVLNGVNLMSFDISLVRLKCILPGISAPMRYLIVQLVGPYCLAVMLVVVLVRIKLGHTRHTMLLEVSNSGGTFIHMFFLSITLSAFMPFMCYEHPNDNGSSMVFLPAVVCYEPGQHMSIIALGVISFLLITLPMLLSALFVALLYPRYVQDIAMTGSKQFSHFRILYVKYRPEAYYYEVILLTRSLALVLVPVLLVDKAAQVLMLVGVILFFVLVQQQINPWRAQWVNLLDGIAGGLFVLIIMSGSLTLDLSLDDHTVKALNNISLTTLVLLMLGGFGATIYVKYLPGPTFHYFICHHKRDAQAQARLLKMLLTSTGRLHVFIDSDDLEELDGLFDLVKRQVKRLAVYLTRETLTRPWCAGEIATACEHKVATIAVRTPTFEMLSEEELTATETYLDASGMALKSYGISFEDVEKAFRRLLDDGVTPTLHLRHWRSSKRFDVLTRELLLQSATVCSSSSSARASSEEYETDFEDLNYPERKPDMLIFSVEPRNDEACAAVGILLQKIKQSLEDTVKRSICRLDDCKDSSSEEFYSITRSYAVVVFLSSGTMSCWQQLRVITRVMRMITYPSEHNMGRPQDAICRAPPKVVPVYIPDFAFPSTDDLLKVVSMHWPDDNEDDKLRLLEGFFRNIAIFFATNAADNVLVAQAAQVASRLADRKKNGQSMPLAVNNSHGSSNNNRRLVEGFESSLSQRNSGSEHGGAFVKSNSGITQQGSLKGMSSARSDGKSDISGNGSTAHLVEGRESYDDSEGKSSPRRPSFSNGTGSGNNASGDGKPVTDAADLPFAKLADIDEGLSNGGDIADERCQMEDLPEGLLRL